jgi:hypothetical protein
MVSLLKRLKDNEMAVDMEYLQRVGSAYAIAELQVAVALGNERLSTELRLFQEVERILGASDGNTDEHLRLIEDVRRSNQLSRLSRITGWVIEIHEITGIGPIVGTDVPEWDSPTHPLKSLEELFPEYCGDK